MFDYTGKAIFLGIDVHKHTYSVTAVCDGSIVKYDTMKASLEGLVTYCKRAFKGATIKSVYEAGFCGFVLHRFLISHEIDNIVVDPKSIEVESGNRKKNDKRDSKKMAIQLAAGRLECVYIPTIEQENRRFVSRLQEVFVRQRIRTASQLKGLLNLNGLIPADKSPKISKKWLREILSLNLNENLKYCIKKYVETWLYFSTKVSEINKTLNFLTPEEQALNKCYRKISGIGPKISRVLMHELGDTMQFSNEEKLFSFCGLTPSEHSSGEHTRLGHITHQGNPILRKLLVQAAWVAVRKDPYFFEYYQKLSKRIGKGRAIIATARKLLGRIRCAIKKKDEYISVKAEG